MAETPQDKRAERALAVSARAGGGVEGIKAVWQAGRAEALEDLAALLRLAAAGRREYAAGRIPEANREVLETEACALSSAARLAGGDMRVMYALLPSWRWEQFRKLVDIDDD